MSKHISISLIVPILFFIFFVIYAFQLVVNEESSFDDFCMKRLANYAADAAVEEILFTGDLGTDYADDYVNVQPDLAVREYCSIMLMGMNMPVNEHNISWLQQHHLKSTIVCAYDGMYVYQERPVYTDTYGFVSTPKIPYYYTDPNGTQFCLTLGLKQARWDSIEGATYKVNALQNLSEAPRVPSKDEQLTAINNQVSYYLQHSVSMAYGGHYGKNYELPALASEVRGGQPVENISVIAVVDTDDKVTSRPNLCMSIGGARVVQNDPVIGFELDGVKYYAHQSKLEEKGYSPDSLNIQDHFVNVYKAADDGYNFYVPAYE